MGLYAVVTEGGEVSVGDTTPVRIRTSHERISEDPSEI